MTDISITAANVKLVSGPTRQLSAGAAITAGQIVYDEANTARAKLADNDSGTSEVRAAAGMALHAASTDQPLTMAKNGAVVDVGAVLTAGTDYYLSGTPGGICPRADVTTGDDPIRIVQIAAGPKGRYPPFMNDESGAGLLDDLSDRLGRGFGGQDHEGQTGCRKRGAQGGGQPHGPTSAGARAAEVYSRRETQPSIRKRCAGGPGASFRR